LHQVIGTAIAPADRTGRTTLRRVLGLAILLGTTATGVRADEHSDVKDQLALETVEVLPATQDADLVVLEPPANIDAGRAGETDEKTSETSADSMDPDTGLRVARKPWLLEKLVGPKPEPSIKMNPPTPPSRVEDPPSLGRISPPESRRTLRPDQDRWTPRRQRNLHAKPSRQSLGSERQSGDRRIPLSDAPTINSAAQDSNQLSGGLRPLLVENSKPLNADAESPNRSEPNRSEPNRSEPSRSEPSRSEPSATPRPEDGNRSAPKDSIQQIKEADPRPDSNQVADDAVAPLELDYAGFPKQPIKLTRSAYRMRRQMYQCLRHYHSDFEVATGRSNWGMMHAMMVYGIDTQVRVGRRTFSTIAWVAGNNVCRGQRLFDEQDGRLIVKSGVGLQGHDGQLLTVFSLCDVPANYPIYAGKKKFAVQDIVESEMLSCKSGNELTFILIALSHYLDTDEQWLSSDGQSWDFERLIREELSQPIVGSACGGTHRLMGFGHALRKRRMEGKPITGQWKRAEQFVEEFVQYTYRLQNRDGSFSTDWFEGREDNRDLDRKVQTTGHMVEWLLTVTPDAQLQNPRLVSAVNFLLKSMDEERKRDWSIGPKGHALRSLAMFYDRVYQSPPPWQNSGVAKNKSKRRHR
jgi:hypothetical protein